MDNSDVAGEWFKVADADLSSAEFLLKMRPLPMEIICYHCQQAAEKYLKGFLAWKGDEIKKTHDLVQLNIMCQKHDHDFKKIQESCLMLTDYGVEIRYPFPLDINESDIRVALKNARKIKNYVRSKSSL